VVGEQLSIDAPKGVMTEAIRQAIRTHKAALLALLSQEQVGTQPLMAEEPLAASPVNPQTTLAALREPAHIWSDMLQADFYVCATPGQAASLVAAGQVTYFPDEIRFLGQLQERAPDTFPEKLKAIHEAKHLFGATLDQVDCLPVSQEDINGEPE
jgi:hypothetical protein